MLAQEYPVGFNSSVGDPWTEFLLWLGSHNKSCLPDVGQLTSQASQTIQKGLSCAEIRLRGYQEFCGRTSERVPAPAAVNQEWWSSSIAQHCRKLWLVLWASVFSVTIKKWNCCYLFPKTINTENMDSYLQQCAFNTYSPNIWGALKGPLGNCSSQTLNCNRKEVLLNQSQEKH